MKKVSYVALLLFMLFCFKTNVLAEDVNINYSTHVQDIGWMNYVKNDELAGTTGRSKRLEGIKININGCTDCIEYRVHVQDIGWMNYVKDNELAGTTGQSKRLEAIYIRLKGEYAEKYDIYYKVHVQDIGWMDYVKNDELAGTTGRSKRLEGIKIKLVQKEGYVETSEESQNDDQKNNKSDLLLNYKSYSGNSWYSSVNNDEVSGTTGQSKSLTLFNMNLINTTNISGSIKYSVYVPSIGWQDYKDSGFDAGIKEEPFEAIKIKLTDELASKYDIYYRTHVSNIGWMAWTKNDSISGTSGFFYPIEAIQVALIEKGKQGKDVSGNAYSEWKNEILYSSHVSDIGWMNYVKNGETGGTTGQSKKMEAIKIKLNTKVDGGISYQTYIENKGWQDYKSTDSISGTTGMSKKIEAIRIKLTGKIANYYDVYYRTHVSNIGWLDWAKNDEKSGSTGNDTQIEAIQIKLVRKIDKFSESTTRPYVTGTFSNNKYTNYFGKSVAGFQLIDGIKYYFDGDGNMVAKNAKKVIDVSSWQGDINWDTVMNYDNVDAAIIRVGWGTSYGDECGLDSKYERNIKEVQRLGIPYGVYIYAYAETKAAAEKEADFVISKLKQYNVPKTNYVWYDAEIYEISRDTYDTVIEAFINRMKSQGYNNVGVYGGVRQLDTSSGNLNTQKIRSYPIWVSQYYKKLQYDGEFMGWQYASDAQIAGIEGNVDVSVFKN